MSKVDKIKEKFEKEIKKIKKVGDFEYFVDIDKKDLLKVVDYIFNDLGGRYNILSASDLEEGFEILYHFSFDDEGKRVTLRVMLSHDNPEVESISSIVKGAQWIEREIMDLLPIKFLNHPDPRRFILSDDWEEGVYPLRREKR